MHRLLPALDDRANAAVREALRSVGGRAVDPAVRDLVEDVLAGHRPIADVLRAPALQPTFARGIAGVVAEWEALDPEERRRLIG